MLVVVLVLHNINYTISNVNRIKLYLTKINVKIELSYFGSTSNFRWYKIISEFWSNIILYLNMTQ